MLCAGPRAIDLVAPKQSVNGLNATVLSGSGYMAFGEASRPLQPTQT